MGVSKRECKLTLRLGKPLKETIDVCRIEAKLQRTINMIEDQKIVVHGQENANGDVDLHVQIDGGEILYLTYYN
jgi:hypothetical protein